jgi:hypothetical protein
MRRLLRKGGCEKVLLLLVAGGLTWSVVQRFPGRFDKLAVMAPFPDMASDALTPATVIGKLNPVTGKPFQPPADSLIIDVRTSTVCTSLAAQAPHDISLLWSLCKLLPCQACSTLKQL